MNCCDIDSSSSNDIVDTVRASHGVSIASEINEVTMLCPSLERTNWRTDLLLSLSFKSIASISFSISVIVSFR